MIAETLTKHTAIPKATRVYNVMMESPFAELLPGFFGSLHTEDLQQVNAVIVYENLRLSQSKRREAPSSENVEQLSPIVSEQLRQLLYNIEAAVSGLCRAGTQDELPKALLTRAWQRSLLGRKTGQDSAQSDLDEAWEIASRGLMPLFMADIHLHRARLCGMSNDQTPMTNDYPWESVKHDLAEARRLIEKHGYGRRMEELEDAEGVLLLEK